MSPAPTAIADLHGALARLARELSSIAATDGNSPESFNGSLMLVLAELGGVVAAASVALEPNLREETNRAIARDVHLAGA